VGGVTGAANPYAAPTARVDDVPASSEAEAIRRAHINHEASIKAVGILYYLGGVGGTLAGIASLVGAAGDAESLFMGLFLVAFGAVSLAGGWGVRALRPWGRIAGCVLSALGLLGFPIGTLVNAYILYLYLSKKGRTIFAPEYKDVIAATPHVKYRTSIVIWVFLALVVGLVVLAVAMPFFSR
jgi:hypothetical protein